MGRQRTLDAREHYDENAHTKKQNYRNKAQDEAEALLDLLSEDMSMTELQAAFQMVNKLNLLLKAISRERGLGLADTKGGKHGT